MEVDEKYKKHLNLLNKTEIINNDTLQKLLENCCKVLTGQKAVYDISTLSQADCLEIKQLYAALLYIFAQCVRNNQSKEEFSNFLLSDFNVDQDRANIVADHYAESFKHIRVQLLNIGNHLPHVTNVRWKVDYIAKSNSLDQSEGPIFRVSLKTEKYDQTRQEPRIEFIEFTCNSQELQDLVYKLKDAVRHCQKLAGRH